MGTDPLRRFIAAVTGVRDARALAEIERLMGAATLNGSLEFCSREALLRSAAIALRAWRRRACA